ncbi:MAG: hypothetical protein IBX72_13685 [Nitrospirae bacterium]|nr:hypothetical protein [Nitrospirota bacterium]
MYDWNSMQEFFKENWGAIIRETRRYHFTPQGCTDELEKSYIDAKKSYAPAKTQNNNYQFLNHYLQYLRTALKQRKTRESREVYLDDILRPMGSEENNHENGNGNGDINGNGNIGSACYSLEINHEDDREKLKAIMHRMICNYGERKAKKTISYLLSGDIEKAFRAMPKLENELRLLKTVVGVKRSD